jgi:hypothetical protein
MRLNKDDIDVAENLNPGKDGQLVITIQGTVNLQHFQQRGDVTIITIAPQELPKRK